VGWPASGFNDAIKRIAYLKSYRTYREKQVNIILETQQLIAKRKEQQLGRKQSKNVALENQTKQVEELAVQKKVKAEVVSQLKSKEKDLGNQIAQTDKEDKVNDMEISANKYGGNNNTKKKRNEKRNDSK